MNEAYSIAPDGEQFKLPTSKDYESEFQRLSRVVADQRAMGREIVIVVGIGFVGAVMAAVIADSKSDTGGPGKFVIGMQRPSTRSYWKIGWFNRGVSPIKADDPEVALMIQRCVMENKNLVATFNEDVLRLADVVVVDVQCDFLKESLGDISTGRVDMADLKKTFNIIGERIPAQALVLIETTVPPGTTEHVACPVIKNEFQRRGLNVEPLLAHSYERVMPGKRYVASIRDFWRVCSGINEESKTRVVKFLSEVINTRDFPLTVMDKPIESETAKVLENTYRTTILALLDEWSLFAERNGVDLIKVIKAIKVRPTHNNIIFPGPGIGGYCLPKDGALAKWAYTNILGGHDDIFKITAAAININDTRALHVVELTTYALRNLERAISDARVLVLGASYKEDVGDTRNSGSEIIVRRLTEMGAEVIVHDPYVEHWWEFEAQDTFPATGHGKAGYFQNQEKLKNLRINQSLNEALKGADAVIFAVRHKQYLELDPDDVVRLIGQPAAIIDCFGIIGDNSIKRYFELGCEVVGLGRGHVANIKKSVINNTVRSKI
jgi:UDP-N-acetyl-D-glucosamine dehydrogenase